MNNTMDHKCPACNANLKFDPHNQNWKCEYCRNTYTLEELQEYSKKIGKKELKEEKSVKLEKDINGMDIYTCSNCGAQIIADENTSATFCVYCKNTAILKNKLVDEFNPDYVIPFKFTKEDAIEKFRKLHKPLMPKIFNDPKNIEETKGVYIPFWLYDYTTSGDIDFTAKRVTSWTSGNYRYTKTDVYEAKRSGIVEFYNVPVDGSLKLDNSIMNSIEPFNYDDLKPFTHSYLSGFLAEKYDVNNIDAKIDAEDRASSSFEEMLKRDVRGYTSVTPIRRNINNVPSGNKVVYAGWSEFDSDKQVVVYWDKDTFVLEKDTIMPLNKYDNIHNEVIATINLIYNNKNKKNQVIYVYKKYTREYLIIDGRKYDVGSEYKFTKDTNIKSFYKEEILPVNLPIINDSNFLGFYDDYGNRIDKLDNITSDMNLYAHYKEMENNEMIIVPNINDVNEFINLTFNYNYENTNPQVVKIPVTKRFEGWVINNILYRPGTKIIKPEEGSYREQYDSIAMINEMSYKPVREGYIFTGWFDKPQDGLLVDLKKVAKGRTVYALLPVWLLNVKYKDKLHTFAMNGQTGKMIGDIPVDKGKAFIWWISVFIGVMIIFVIVYFVRR